MFGGANSVVWTYEETTRRARVAITSPGHERDGGSARQIHPFASKLNATTYLRLCHTSMADSDIRTHALNSSHDFYELLGVQSSAGESEIRRAYRKTALKYHPDKVGATDTAALEKFHLLQIAYDVLLDENVRQLYDNARRAREEKKERDAAYDVRRRKLKEDLERRESAGVAGLKRKRNEATEEEAFQRELNRLAADGARRRKEREEQLRKAAQEELEREERNGGSAATVPPTNPTGVEEIDRTIKLRYSIDTPGLDKAELASRFSRFGKIQDVVLRNKKLKTEGEKHRREFVIAIIVYQSIVGAHSAVMDFPALAKSDPRWGVFEQVEWASGKEPDCVPKLKTQTPAEQKPFLEESAPSTPTKKFSGDGLRKVPSFGSFKGTPKAANGNIHNGLDSPSMDELTQMRLKNMERRRLAEKLRKEEAEAEAKESLQD